MKSVFLLIAAGFTTWATAENKPEPADSLQISRDLSLNEVVVTATRVAKGTPVAYSELSHDELNRSNDGQGIPFLISQSPSVIMNSDAGTGVGYSSFRIRGTDASRINITVGGVPINDSESHTVFWANMADFASSVNSIQIQRGVGTSTNGAAAFGATVAMETEKPSLAPYAEYSFSGGSFGTFKNAVKVGTGLIHDHFVFDARYSNVRSDGYIDRASALMHSYFGAATYYAANTMIRFQTFGNMEKTYQAWTGVPSSLLESDRTYNPCGEYEENGMQKYYDNQTDNYWQQHYHLMANQRLSDLWSMNLTLHYTHGKGYYEDYKASAKFSSYKLPAYNDSVNQSDLVRRKWLDNDFYGAIYNVAYRSERLQMNLGAAANRYVGDHFGRVMWVKNGTALPQPDYEYYRNQGDKVDYNVYAKGIYRFTPYLNGYLDLQYRGIRYTIEGSDDKAGDNVDISKHWHFFNPKAGINYQRGNHDAFVSFSVAHREPTRDNFTEAAVGERPEHETLLDYEAGYSFHNKHFNVGANLYFMDYDNQLILTGKISEIGETLTSNIKDSYRMGIELTGGVRIASWLDWSGNLTLSRNKILHYTNYMDNYDTGGQSTEYLGTTDISFSPNIIAGSIFDFHVKGFSANFSSRAVSRQYIDNTSTRDRSIDPYFVNNLRVGYVFHPSFIKELGLDVTVNNIFNEKYETSAWVYTYISGGEVCKDDGYFTQAGTNVMARVTLKF